MPASVSVCAQGENSGCPPAGTSGCQRWATTSLLPENSSAACRRIRPGGRPRGNCRLGSGRPAAPARRARRTGPGGAWRRRRETESGPPCRWRNGASPDRGRDRQRSGPAFPARRRRDTAGCRRTERHGVHLHVRQAVQPETARSQPFGRTTVGWDRAPDPHLDVGPGRRRAVGEVRRRDDRQQHERGARRSAGSLPARLQINLRFARAHAASSRRLPAGAAIALQRAQSSASGAPSRRFRSIGRMQVTTARTFRARAGRTRPDSCDRASPLRSARSPCPQHACWPCPGRDAGAAPCSELRRASS